MSNPIVIACLAAVFSWWFFTGVILLLVRYSDSASYRVRGFYAIASLPLFLIGFLLINFSAQFLSILAVYLSFIGALFVWGWLEYVFLIGIITGPNVSNCPESVSNSERFIRAWGTLAYHEIALLFALGVIFYLGWSAENMFGVWTFVILYVARVCAKLNLFFGVPRVNVEFVPKTLSHLTSYFRISALNWFFPLSITILSIALGCWIERILSVNLISDVIGFTLLATLTAMALLEHWVMVLPIPDAKLWRWMLPQEKQKVKHFRRKDYHGL